jgi:hypothetical protein
MVYGAMPNQSPTFFFPLFIILCGAGTAPGTIGGNLGTLFLYRFLLLAIHGVQFNAYTYPHLQAWRLTCMGIDDLEGIRLWAAGFFSLLWDTRFST